MTKIHRSHSPSFKAKVAIDLIKEVDTVSAICSQNSIHPTQANKWKRHAIDNLQNLYSEKQTDELKKKDVLVEQLYQQIGQLTVERDWLKKKFGS